MIDRKVIQGYESQIEELKEQIAKQNLAMARCKSKLNELQQSLMDLSISSKSYAASVAYRTVSEQVGELHEQL